MLTSKEKSDTKRLPMMPIRDVVIFPYMMTPFVVGRESSVRALEEAMAGDKKIFLATQHDASIDEPKPNEIYSVGTIVNIVQSLKLPDGNIKVLVEGVERGKVVSVSDEEGFFRAMIRTSGFKVEAGPQLDQLISRVTGLFEQYVKLSQNLNYETMIAAIRVDDPGKLADTVGANLQLTIEEKQELLEIFDPIDRLTRVSATDLRLLRRIIRDRHQRGYKAADNIARWPSVQAGERKHIFPFQEQADAIFDSSLIYEPAVLKVYAERYLLEVPSSHPAYATAHRLRHLIDRFVSIYPDHVPPTSMIREFIGGSGFEY